MPIPDTTSAEGLKRYMGGKCIRASHGDAWKNIKTMLFTLPSVEGKVAVPAISESVLTWITSGEIEAREREVDGPWMTSRVKKRSFFLATAGSPYECHWKTLSAEPFEYMISIIELPLLQRAFEEVFGDNAVYARLQDVSGFTDVVLSSLMERLHGELSTQKASQLYVEGIAQAIAIHLARNYTILVKKTRKESPSLPGYKLKRITDWMIAHISEEFNLARLAALAGVSKFHFHRLFKSAAGVSPAQYHIHLRMDEARRLLRETTKSVIDVALEVGYTNPSHFAKLFHRETGLSPSNYRRER